MLVYGNPAVECSLPELIATFRAQAAATTRSSPDQAREILTRAGQLEQGAADALPTLAPAEHVQRLDPIMRITDAAARVFVEILDRTAELMHRSDVSRQWNELIQLLDSLEDLPDAPVSVKVPEGFAFYALYPEQYVQSALRWLTDHAGASRRRVIVIGVRSIGTTLSAVVAATLRSRGVDVRRLTVRPTGHPFERRVRIDQSEICGATYGLIVDEGPGISGSSMAAAAQALAEAGIDRSCIAFLPGHDGPPGNAASPEVRAWWETTPRYAVPLDQMRWAGRTPSEHLSTLASAICGTSTVRVEDLSAGQWRKLVYPDPTRWPAVCASFERTKYRCILEDGRSVLWKFMGLAGTTTHSAANRLKDLAGKGWTAAPLGSSMGFIALPWIEGTPLMLGDVDRNLIQQIGRYIVEAARPPLTRQELDASCARLGEMLVCNVREALGEAIAARAGALAERAGAWLEARMLPRYGDGRMAPHEWRRTADGRLQKTDCTGHDADHTLIGRQPILWDVAGVAVEWGLDDTATEQLLEAVRPIAPQPPSDVLHFFRAAYAAFRMGQCDLCAKMIAGAAEEQSRLENATEFYRRNLQRL